MIGEGSGVSCGCVKMCKEWECKKGATTGKRDKVFLSNVKVMACGREGKGRINRKH